MAFLLGNPYRAVLYPAPAEHRPKMPASAFAFRKHRAAFLEIRINPGAPPPADTALPSPIRPPHFAGRKHHFDSGTKPVVRRKHHFALGENHFDNQGKSGDHHAHRCDRWEIRNDTTEIAADNREIHIDSREITVASPAKAKPAPEICANIQEIAGKTIGFASTCYLKARCVEFKPQTITLTTNRTTE